MGQLITIKSYPNTSFICSSIRVGFGHHTEIELNDSRRLIFKSELNLNYSQIEFESQLVNLKLIFLNSRQSQTNFVDIWFELNLTLFLLMNCLKKQFI